MHKLAVHTTSATRGGSHPPPVCPLHSRGGQEQRLLAGCDSPTYTATPLRPPCRTCWSLLLWRSLRVPARSTTDPPGTASVSTASVSASPHVRARAVVQSSVLGAPGRGCPSLSPGLSIGSLVCSKN